MPYVEGGWPEAPTVLWAEHHIAQISRADIKRVTDATGKSMLGVELEFKEPWQQALLGRRGNHVLSTLRPFPASQQLSMEWLEQLLDILGVSFAQLQGRFVRILREYKLNAYGPVIAVGPYLPGRWITLGKEGWVHDDVPKKLWSGDRLLGAYIIDREDYRARIKWAVPSLKDGFCLRIKLEASGDVQWPDWWKPNMEGDPILQRSMSGSFPEIMEHPVGPVPDLLTLSFKTAEEAKSAAELLCKIGGVDDLDKLPDRLVKLSGSFHCLSHPILCRHLLFEKYGGVLSRSNSGATAAAA